jgi:hypothetical protein
MLLVYQVYPLDFIVENSIIDGYMPKKESIVGRSKDGLPAVSVGENWITHWFGLTSMLAWLPATYDEIIREKYPNCLDLLDNPRLSSRSNTAGIMAEIAYLSLHAEAPMPLSYFTDRGLRYGLTMSRALFYLACAYDASYNIVALGSAAVEMPPLLRSQTQNGFPPDRLMPGQTFERSEAFQSLRAGLLDGSFECTALRQAQSRLTNRGIL